MNKERIGGEFKDMLQNYSENTFVAGSCEEVFAYADDHKNFSYHMNNSSWMMGGGSMTTQMDKKEGRGIGAHIIMKGKAFGIPLFLDEVVTDYKPPHLKVWQTVGDVNLVVIGHYRLGFEIKPKKDGSQMNVFINYELPQSPVTYPLGVLFGGMYARWCVKQMLAGVIDHFKGGENR